MGEKTPLPNFITTTKLVSTLKIISQMKFYLLKKTHFLGIGIYITKPKKLVNLFLIKPLLNLEEENISLGILMTFPFLMDHGNFRDCQG